uniref:NADH:ubiquinone reductase (H(+)-translocating) n=1 Tax=Kalanchoe fedtschenkoi TaxID=63787 RepID=A0A7N0UIJ9_KALFE
MNDFLVRSFLRFGYEVSFEALDKGAIEILGPYGISYTFRRLAERISQLQSGFVVRRVPMDKGTSESSLLGAGSPLPSIPLHSIGDIRGSCEWRFPCREPDEVRPSRPVRRAGISRPYYHYAFAMLLGSTLFVTFSRMWDSISSWVDNRSSFIWIVSCFYNNKSSQE